MRDISVSSACAVTVNTWLGGKQNTVLAGDCYCLGACLTSLKPEKNGWTGCNPCPCPIHNKLFCTSKKQRPSLIQSSQMALSPTCTNLELSLKSFGCSSHSEVGVDMKFYQGHSHNCHIPWLDPHLCWVWPNLSHCKHLNGFRINLNGFRINRRIVAISYPTSMMIGRVGTSNVKTTVGRGKGVPPLFWICLYASDTEKLTRAVWISTLFILFNTSAFTAPKETLREISLLV
jgi:hypothetical protein